MKLMDLNSSERFATEQLVAMLLDGSILRRLREDISDIRIQDPAEYFAYIEEHYRAYANNSFALYNGYRLDIICTGILASESLLNATLEHLRLNDYLGFCLVDTRGQTTVKVSTYDDLVGILREERDE